MARYKLDKSVHQLIQTGCQTDELPVTPHGLPRRPSTPQFQDTIQHSIQRPLHQATLWGEDRCPRWVARLQRAGNNLPSTVDLFHDGVRTLKWKVKGAVLPT
ncbi:hypothetical protein J6590_038470 [Homalodisca vitripennis]|nr:hypothetical protein J6590_038470 [Homalodisca vitripennis]